MKQGGFSDTFYWMAVALLSLPLCLLLITSLTDASVVGFPLGHPSLRWYREALTDGANGRAFTISIGLAICSACLAALAGTWIALAARMLGPRSRWLLLAGTMVPLVTPGVVHAIGLRIGIRQVGLDPGLLAMLIGHTVHATPLTAIMITARLDTTPRDLMDAARDVGAGPIQGFLNVQLPWLLPSLAAALVLAALNSFDDFVRSFFLGGYEPTLPVLIFGRLRTGLTPEINAVSTLSLLFVIGVFVIAVRVMRARRPWAGSGEHRRRST